jgi:CRISPR/Cas system-associated protein Cas10 (large subunit of type III CRISPR-Cas system)
VSAAVSLAPPPALSALAWWRVEFATGGAIVSVSPVDHQELAEGLVVYVRAKTEELARLRAQAERQRVALQWRRRAYREAGLCRCGRQPRQGRRECQVCADRRASDAEVRRQRLAGITVTRESKAVAYRQRIDDERRQARIDLLLEVRSAWARLRSPREFTEWLRVRIGGET